MREMITPIKEYWEHDHSQIFMTKDVMSYPSPVDLNKKYANANRNNYDQILDRCGLSRWMGL